jgi:hypothetical protein
VARNNARAGAVAPQCLRPAQSPRGSSPFRTRARSGLSECGTAGLAVVQIVSATIGFFPLFCSLNTNLRSHHSKACVSQWRYCTCSTTSLHATSLLAATRHNLRGPEASLLPSKIFHFPSSYSISDLVCYGTRYYLKS